MPEHPTACSEWQDDLAGWLMGQVTPGREQALEAHLVTCPTCRTEADSLLAVAAVGLGLDPTGGLAADGPPPSDDLPDRIVAQVRAERRARHTTRRSLAVVAAAIILAVILATRPDPNPPLQGRPVTFAVRPDGVDADAIVAAHPAGALVQLTATGLDPGTTYALWLTAAGGGYQERVPAGTFRPDARGRVDEVLRSALPAADTGRVWVTDAVGDITLDTDPSNEDWITPLPG